MAVSPAIQQPRKPPVLTPDIRQKAAETRRARAATLRSDVAHDGLRPYFPDDRANWDALAAAAGVKLPPYGVPCTVGRMGHWLKVLGIPVEAYLVCWSGVGLDGTWDSARLSDHIKRDPRCPLKAWVGMMLEGHDHILLLWEIEQRKKAAAQRGI